MTFCKPCAPRLMRLVIHKFERGKLTLIQNSASWWATLGNSEYSELPSKFVLDPGISLLKYKTGQCKRSGAKELMPSNCGAGEDSWESLGLHGDQISQSLRKSTQNIYIGRTDTEAEAPILWPSDAKRWLIGKDPDARKDWRQEEKGVTEDEMVGWHHQLSEHEFEQALGVGEGQGGLVCCSAWGHKELSTT